ncbi:uncharacterized protein LOC111082351 [Drosophila obscura]|uniref:uncharacterized protein LOC111082351 n=1 Tax=Drosophila obscura TaxID=7282 RepID=UPI000BA11A06|nr:uncharacterized protein LOC111082351 [Drosophila obscura]
MTKKSSDKFVQKSRTFWLTLVRLLMHLLRSIYQGHCDDQTRERPERTSRQITAPEEDSNGIDPRIAEHRRLLERRAEEYAKVELLHRLLVRQQLHELQQRRLMRLALARRRLQFSN